MLKRSDSEQGRSPAENLNPKFENYNQFKLYIRNYKEEMKILRP